MKDSLGQTANVGDLIICTDYSQTGMYYGIVTKVSAGSIGFVALVNSYWSDDYNNAVKSNKDIYITRRSSKKLSPSLFTVINPLLNVVLATKCTLYSHAPKPAGCDASVEMTWGDVYEIIKKELCF